MSGHTPGPWRICLGLICADTPKGQAELASVYKESEYVAPLPHIANARLMAAAPDLLAACKASLEQMGLTKGHAAVLDAAIAKAEGR